MAGYTRRQWVTLVVFSVAHFCTALCVSLQGPFYPAEAEKKGATAIQYGFVFGVFQLTAFLVSPIYGRFMSKWDAKFINIAGILTISIMCIIFGFLDRLDDTTSFIGFSIAVRIVEATGNAALHTSSFSIIAKEFPNSIGAAFASMETFFGLGLIVGPTIGGALYELGGYTLPFGVLGVVLLAAALMTCCCLPSVGAEASSEAQTSMGEFLAVIRLPSIILACFAITSTAITIGFLQTSLEPHLRPLHLSPLKMGFMFVLSGSAYALTAQFWGWLCDKHVSPRSVTAFGAVVLVVAYSIVGPMPFLPLDTTLGLCIGSLVIHGVGVGAELVSTFAGAHRDVVASGFPDDLSTYGLVSGIWTSAFALGCFIGPSVGGVLMDAIGFKWATVLVTALLLLVALSTGVYMCCGGSDPGRLYSTTHHSLANEKDEGRSLLYLKDDDSTYGTAGSSQGNLGPVP